MYVKWIIYESYKILVKTTESWALMTFELK